MLLFRISPDFTATDLALRLRSFGVFQLARTPERLRTLSGSQRTLAFSPSSLLTDDTKQASDDHFNFSVFDVYSSPRALLSFFSVSTHCQRPQLLLDPIKTKYSPRLALSLIYGTFSLQMIFSTLSSGFIFSCSFLLQVLLFLFVPFFPKLSLHHQL